MEYALTIPGKPFAKQRPKYGKGVTYTPKETINYEVFIKTLFQNKYGQVMLDGELAAEIKAYYEIAKSGSKKTKLAMASGLLRPTKKPDLDNIAKSVLDSLNGIAYKDDSQITTLSVAKYYSDEPRVELLIRLENAGRGIDEV